MKIKLLLFISILSICLSCKAQPSEPGIKISNGLDFKQNEVVKYEVAGPAKIYYYVGIEQLLDGKWREIILDVSSNVPDRAAAVKPLAPAKPVSGVYALKNIPAMFLKNGQSFRLKMNYGKTVTAIEKVVVSTEFKVK